MAKALRFSVIAILITGILLWIILSDTPESLLTLSAVFIHELGHLCASLICKNSFNRISFQSGGLKLSGNSAYSSYSSEAIIAFAGPFFNLVSALTFMSARSSMGIFFRQVSLALALLNLFPIKEFDGGRILRCIFNLLLPIEYSEKICEIFSFLALFFIWSISVYVILKTNRNVSALVFSAMIFLKMIKKSPQKRICEIIKE